MSLTTTSTCIICTEIKRQSDMFSSSGCSHSFCTTCISHYISAKLQDNIPKVRCPDPDCHSSLDPNTCSSFLPKETLSRWEDALCESAIVGVHTFFCPFVDCSVTMIDDGDETVTAAECMNCRRMFCAQCKVGWHADMSCEEYINESVRCGIRPKNENENDLKAMELAEKNKWKRCPNCKIYVSKIEGCVWIKCRCGSQFCYSCGANSGGDHACPDSAFARQHHR